MDAEVMSALIVGIVFVAVAVPTIAHYCYRVVIRNSENRLKQSLVDRGMSAEEIERVIKATSAGADDKDDEQ